MTMEENSERKSRDSQGLLWFRLRTSTSLLLSLSVK